MGDFFIFLVNVHNNLTSISSSCFLNYFALKDAHFINVRVNIDNSTFIHIGINC
jgi:hypothetical protein